jgi:hypothetical protein
VNDATDTRAAPVSTEGFGGLVERDSTRSVVEVSSEKPTALSEPNV